MFKNHLLFLISLLICALPISVTPAWADDDDDDRRNRHHQDDDDDDDDERRNRHNGKGDKDDDDDKDDKDDDDDDRDRRKHRCPRGCKFDWHRGHKHVCPRIRVINLDHGLVLTSTTNAPAGAKGRARIIFVNDNGTNYETLFVKTVNLTNTTYAVDVTDDTGTNVFDLGTLNVVTKTNIDSGSRFNRYCTPWGGGTNVVSAGFAKWVWENARKKPQWSKLMRLSTCTNLFSFATNAYCMHTNTLMVGSGSFLLPAGLSHSNATIINISDSTNVVLTGDFSTATNSTVTYKEIANVIPGTATNAQGMATITYRLARNKAVGTFKLQATNLPPREKLFLTAESTTSTNKIKVCTSSQGALTVRSFRRLDIVNVQNIVATDRSSNVVFSVSFSP